MDSYCPTCLTDYTGPLIEHRCMEQQQYVDECVLFWNGVPGAPGMVLSLTVADRSERGNTRDAFTSDAADRLEYNPPVTFFSWPLGPPPERYYELDPNAFSRWETLFWTAINPLLGSSGAFSLAASMTLRNNLI